jgi:hypothetical protein
MIGFDAFKYGIIKRRVVEGQDESHAQWRLGHPILFPNILWVGSTLQGRIEARQHITAGMRDEAAAKEQRTLDTQRTGSTAGAAAPHGARFLNDLGLLVVSCEYGEMRQSPAGIYIYGDAGTTEVPLTETRGAYAPELDELYEALVYGKPVLHSGRWGLATLEVCLAIMRSATAHRNIAMQHQVAVPDGA